MSKEEVEFRLDESNELIFRVQIEAPEPAKPRYRFVCESASVSYMFIGRVASDGTVRVTVPPMKQRLSEGRCDAWLEVIINDKYFVPVELDANFVQPVRVTCESVSSSSKTIASASKRISGDTKKPSSISARGKLLKTEARTRKQRPPARKRKKGSLREDYDRRRKAGKKQDPDIEVQDMEQLRAFLRHEIKGGG